MEIRDYGGETLIYPFYFIIHLDGKGKAKQMLREGLHETNDLQTVISVHETFIESKVWLVVPLR